MNRKTIFVILGLFIIDNLFAKNIETSSLDLETKKNQIYSKNDDVLFNIDCGMIKFYEGNNTGAIEKLQIAEDGIFENYTKSISQYTESGFVNDLVIDYAGEDYEDMYINLFKSLAYVNLGKRNDAIVEINRFINKSKEISSRHETELIEARQLMKRNNKIDINIQFHDSALGEYLALLYYRSIGDKSTMQSSARFINEAFTTQKSVYDFTIPKSIKEEISVTKNDARLNFVCFTGLSPVKIEDSVKYSDEFFVSVPALQKYKDNIGAITIKAVNLKTGREYTTSLEKIENISNIAMDTFKSNAALYYYKSVYRALAKGGISIGSNAAGEILADSSNPALAITGNALKAGATLNKNAAFETDKADLRLSKYLPGRADIGGITVESGFYNIEINYKDTKGYSLFNKTIKDFEIKESALNLISDSSTLDEIKADLITYDNSNDSRSRYSALEEENKLHFDLGTEPDVAGSSSYGTIQYDWLSNTSSRIDIRYTSQTEVNEELDGYANVIDTIKTRVFEFNLLPLVKNINSYITTSFGLSYQYTYQNEFAGMFDINGYMLDEGDEGKYFTMFDEKKAHFIAPRIGISTIIPVGNNFSLNLEGFINPVYYMILNQNMGYFSNQTSTLFDYSGSNSIKTTSLPFVDLKVSVDILKFFRLMTKVNYQRLSFQQMDWNENYDGLKGYDDIQDILSWRFGIELLSVNKKNARLKGGIYYQLNWNKSSYLDKTDFDKKIVLCIGSEL